MGRCTPFPDELVRELLQTGMLSREELTEYFDTFPPEKKPRDRDTLLGALARDGKLSSYQVRALTEGKAAQLAWGQYVLVERIGHGGMGQVFKALDRVSRRPVAIKILRRELSESPEFVRRFYREVKIASRLMHQHIVSTYGAGDQHGFHYLVMEYVDGRDLGERVEQGGPLAAARAVDYVMQAAQGLGYAHGQNVVHRDVKPANLLLDPQGHIKISDLGLARNIETADGPQSITLDERLTQAGQFLGTADYMSPEQTFDARNCDARADIYALGCTLHWLLRGQPVYPAENRLKKLLAHASAPIPRLSDALAGLPRQLDAVFAKMIAKRPDDRYPSMQAVAADLLPCLEVLQQPGSATVSAPGPTAASSVAATQRTDVFADATRVTGTPQTMIDLAQLPAHAQPAVRAQPKGYCDVDM